MATEAELAEIMARAEKRGREHIRKQIARAYEIAREADLSTFSERDVLLESLAFEAEQMLDWIEANEAKG